MAKSDPDPITEAVLSPDMVQLLAKLSGVTARLEKAVDRLEGSVETEESYRGRDTA